MVFFREYPTLLPSLNHKVYYHENCGSLYSFIFYFNCFYDLETWQEFHPSTLTFISKEFIGYLNTVGF